ncbi:hypothetical protein NHQ30_006846 [Ciborinia camelliae]|nr:hypothetical protein NHQ30_006846 [Ciborinia camelliae]
MADSNTNSRAGTPEPVQHQDRSNTSQKPQDRIKDVVDEVLKEETGTFVYNDINYNEEIRVLRILRGERESQISCVLLPSALPSSNGHSNSKLKKLEYCALSYYWGDDDPAHQISISEGPDSEGAKPMSWEFATRFIQKNLHEALLQLRSATEGVNVWCDALCINQANKKEKAAQVARMHEVYLHAEKVCVWLGASNDQQGGPEVPKRAFSFLKKILDLEVLDRIVGEKEGQEDWMLIINLMKNDWFMRRWVVQELALAKNAWIRYADQEMKWMEFADAIALFVTKFEKIKHILKESNTDFGSFRKPDGYLGNLDASALGANKLVTATSRLFRRSDDGRIEQRLLTLETLVSSLLLPFEASDPKDTIFAALSLAKDTWTMDSELDIRRRLNSKRRRGIVKVALLVWQFLNWLFRILYTLFISPSKTPMAVLDPRIQPNYQKCLSDVCADFMEYCIEKSNSLDILCKNWAPKPKPKTPREKIQYTKSRREDEKLPSWIPSIDRSAFGSPKNAKMGRINGDSFVFVDGSRRPQYNASFGLRPKVRFGKKNRYDFKGDNNDPTNIGEPDVKPVYAKKLENSQLPPKFDGTMYVEGFQLDIISKKSDAVNGGLIPAEALKMGGYKKGSSAEECEPSDALWRTLVADRGPDGVNAPNWYRRACAYCLDICLLLDASGDLNINEIKRLRKTPEVLLEFLDRVQAVVWKRRFFLTSGKVRKRLFGLMPFESEEEDVVCIFFGCTVPVVLRRKYEGGKWKGAWRFVGECYVHGMMDGEAVTEDLPKKLEVFKLI